MRRAARLACISLAAVACATATDLGSGIAVLEIRGPAPATLAVGATTTLTAVALNGDGDTLAVDVEWSTPDTLQARVGGASGIVTGRAPGSARVQVRAGDAVSAFFTLTVVPAPAS